MRRFTLILLPVGPLCIALLRFLLPYYTASTNTATAQAVLAHPARENAVLWLSVAAMLTLLPGLLTVTATLPATPWRTWALALMVPGYLSLGALVCEDSTMWSASQAHLGSREIGALLAQTHPAIDVATGIFVAGHVFGTVLLGVAVLRSTSLPGWIGWLAAVSQPLHVLAFLVLGWPLLDLIGYTLLAIAMAGVAQVLIRRPATTPTPTLIPAAL